MIRSKLKRNHKLKVIFASICSLALVITLIPLPQLSLVNAYNWYTNDHSNIFREDFNGDTLDPTKWLIAGKQWGGRNNNGVVPENVKLEDGKLILEAHGDLYDGDVLGLYRLKKSEIAANPELYNLPYGVDTIQRGKTRVGAAIATQAYMASGRYTMYAKMIREPGVASTMWTFNYQEYYGEVETVNGVPVASGDPEYVRAFKEGKILPINGEYPDYYVYNHEIDIEVPGRPSAAHQNISHDYALFNTFTGEMDHEYQTSYSNVKEALEQAGKTYTDDFHKYEFRWHTGGNGETPRVDYYVDDVFITSNTDFIPTNAGRLWLGVWFPDTWAGGAANFDVKQMEVDWFEYEPYHEPGDTWMPESFADDGWEDSDFRPMTAEAVNTRYGVSDGVFFDDFNGDRLDSSKWKIAKKNWGGKLGNGINWNGGVHPDNVKLDGAGNLILEAHGNYFNGLPLGLNANGTSRKDGKRVGAAIATNRYFGSGEYEVRMKIPAVLKDQSGAGLPHGAVPAIWTFHYQEMDATHPEAVALGADPNAEYWVSNNEIDIELPGRPGFAHENISFEKALFNTWRGEKDPDPITGQDGEYYVNFADIGFNASDDEFHTYKFIWQIEDAAHNKSPFVEFYVDNQLIWKSEAQHFIPNKPGRLWLGYWFPRNWGGNANFDKAQLVIDYVSIKPYDVSGAVVQQESYPLDGWAAIEEYPGYCALQCTEAQPGDTEAPSIPMNVELTAKTDTSVTIKWDASTDNVGVTGYVVQYGTKSIPVSGTTATINGLLANTEYSFTVKARDGAGNYSAPSTPLIVQTEPSNITNLLINGDFNNNLVNDATQGWKSIGTGTTEIAGGKLKLTPSAIDIAEVEQIVNVTVGDTYRLTADLSSTGVYGYVRAISNSQIIAEDFTSSHKATNITFTATESTVRIVLHAYKQQTGMFTVGNIALVHTQ